jgi:hypothetical protein
MSDFQEQIFSERGGLKNLLSKVPGFKGYIEKEDRRTADKMLREMVADRFEELQHQLSNIQQEFVREGKLDLMDELEAIDVKFNTFVDRIRHATYGYSGFFDAVKIDEAKLDKMYAYDNALLDAVDGIQNALDSLNLADEEDVLKENIRTLDDLLRQSIQAVNRRKEVITNE